MSKRAKISVLTALYNTDFAYVKRAIDSVLRQDCQDFELIIIDDGSKDNDRQSLLQYVEQHEEKIIYIRHSNRGQSESINRGVLNSAGEYIAILDSDDEYKPNHLSACLREIEGFETPPRRSAQTASQQNIQGRGGAFPTKISMFALQKT